MKFMIFLDSEAALKYTDFSKIVGTLKKSDCCHSYIYILQNVLCLTVNFVQAQLII